MTGPDILGMVKLIIAVGVPTAGFIWAWGKKTQSFESSQVRTNEAINMLSNTISGMVEKLDLIDKEVYPAFKNGGVVTKDQLERRIGFAEEAIRGEIKLLAKSIENGNKQAQLEHGFAEDQLVRIVKKAMEA